MKEAKYDTIETKEGGLVLREVWCIKDKLSAARGHSIDRLFTEARERQKHSGHPVVNFQNKRHKDRDKV